MFSLKKILNFFRKKYDVVGIIRMRNEELILQDTLDSLSNNVDAIIVFDDASTDSSVKIAKNHPAVIEVIENRVWKKNRVKEETDNRQTLLDCARKYNPKWIFYTDCDERFEGNIKEFLNSNGSGDVDGIRIKLFDAYITADDKKCYRHEKLFNFRKFFGPERRDILMIWKDKPEVNFVGLDQREPQVKGNIITKFYCQHYGKSLSEDHWEETCDYYINNFPEPYKSKWKNRKGKAVHVKSDFERELYLWEDVKNMSVKIN